jgi:hypothetical protein
MTTPDKMTSGQLAMLISGIVLFVFAVGLVAYLAKHKRSFTSTFVLFPVAIIMIGFSSIKSAEVLGIKFDEKTAADYVNNPTNAEAIASYNQKLNELENAITANPGKSLPPEVHSNLMYAADALSRRANLTPASRLALSRTQLILGQTNAAAINASSAVAANTNLLHTIDPHLKMLIRPVTR